MSQEHEHSTPYKSFVAAVHSGDDDAAAKFALAAWQSAEGQLGNHQVTADLAYVYARQVILTNVASAYEALTRARRLQKKGIANLPVLDLRLLYAYASYHTGRMRISEARELTRALYAMNSQNREPYSEFSAIWQIPATADFSVDQYREVLSSLRETNSTRRIDTPITSRSFAAALTFRGAARLTSLTVSDRDREDALQDFRLACRQLSPQSDLDTFDPLFAQILAWQNVSLFASENGQFQPRLIEGPYADVGTINCDVLNTITPGDSEQECELPEWVTKVPIYRHWTATSEKWAVGLTGGILYGFNLGEDLVPKDIVILADVPNAYYIQGTVDDFYKAVKFSRAKPGMSDKPVCKRNLLGRWSLHFR